MRPEGCNDSRSDCDIRHEVTVHHIDACPVTAGFIYRAHLFAEPGEISRKNGRGNEDVAHSQYVRTEAAGSDLSAILDRIRNGQIRDKADSILSASGKELSHSRACGSGWDVRSAQEFDDAACNIDTGCFSMPRSPGEELTSMTTAHAQAQHVDAADVEAHDLGGTYGGRPLLLAELTATALPPR